MRIEHTQQKITNVHSEFDNFFYVLMICVMLVPLKIKYSKLRAKNGFEINIMKKIRFKIYR